MYGNIRYLYDQKLTASMLTANSYANGVVTGAQKDGTGSATLVVAGVFSGSDDLVYTIVIDSVSAGAEIGSATFAWKTSDTTPGAWEATGVATDTDLISLNNGMYVAWEAGAGDDFAYGDSWVFAVFATHSIGKAVDWDRHTTYRSAALESPNTVSIDLGSAETITACVIADHNMTDAATVTLKAGTTSACSNYSQALTVAETIIEYLNQEYRYWKLEITDAANPDSYIEIGTLYLGGYMELDVNPEWGATHGNRNIVQSAESQTGIRRRYWHSRQASFEYNYPWLEAADLALLLDMLDGLYDEETHQVARLFLHEFYEESDRIYMVEAPDEYPYQFVVYNIYALNLTFTGVVKAI